MKDENYNRHHRNTKDNKRLLQTICTTTRQQNEQFIRNGQILRKVQSPNTELGRNRKYEHTNCK